MGLNEKFFKSADGGLDGIEIAKYDASNTNSYPPGNGSTFYDLTSNGNDATRSGPSWQTAGYFQFDGINDKFILTGLPDFPTSTTQTNNVKSIAAWIKPDTTAKNMYIFSVSSTDQTKDYFTFDMVQSIWSGAPDLRVRVQNGGSGDRLDALVNITATNAWTHVVAQLGANGVEMYINGVSQTVNYTTSGNATNSYWIANISYQTSVATLMGQYRQTSSGSNTTNSDGRMSKTTLFSRALTQLEIEALHNEGE